MLTSTISMEDALALLKKYNPNPFHLLHGLTVSGVMRWYAGELGYADEADYWAIAGLLHDIDYGMYPEEHCVKAAELLRDAAVSEDMIYSIQSHGYPVCVDLIPRHTMEKVLYATDELTGLIGAVVRMRPSQSAMDLELPSLAKKFKDKRFAAGCSRDVIEAGAVMLGWSMDELLEKTILAMRSCEDSVNESLSK